MVGFRIHGCHGKLITCGSRRSWSWPVASFSSATKWETLLQRWRRWRAPSAGDNWFQMALRKGIDQQNSYLMLFAHRKQGSTCGWNMMEPKCFFLLPYNRGMMIPMARCSYLTRWSFEGWVAQPAAKWVNRLEIETHGNSSRLAQRHQLGGPIYVPKDDGSENPQTCRLTGHC